MAERFSGKVALVTGAASGIGRATAVAFARAGARVVVADISEAGGQETVRMAQAAGGEGTFVRCDVSQPAQVETLVSAAVAAFGQLDCAVNNAGIEGVPAVTAEYPEDVWQRVIGINLTGQWLGMKHEITQMLAQGHGGAIVNMASILGVVGFATAAAYTAAKHGLIGLTQVAALEYADKGIRVNAVCPGFIDTPMVMDRGVGARTHPEVYQMLVGLHPMGRLGKPEEIAEAVLWLCSDVASFVTGHALLVDGGYTAR
jgi:NAD(P)-dependent dehydrogenase (short-subunit alcohol dehydrogenase family)